MHKPRADDTTIITLETGDQTIDIVCKKFDIDIRFDKDKISLVLDTDFQLPESCTGVDVYILTTDDPIPEHAYSAVSLGYGMRKIHALGSKISYNKDHGIKIETGRANLHIKTNRNDSVSNLLNQII